MAINILIVEDSEMYKKVLEKMFDDILKYDLTSASSVKAAKEEIVKKKYEIILLDISLPDGTGNEIAKYIRKEQNNNKSYIVAITGEVSEDIIAGLFKIGIDYYFKKPFNPMIVKATIERLVDRIYDNRNGDDL